MTAVEQWLEKHKLKKDDIVLHKGIPVYLKEFGGTIISVSKIKETKHSYTVPVSELIPLEKTFNGFIEPVEKQKVRLKIIPVNSIHDIGLHTIDPPSSTDDILTYHGKHNGAAPFVMLYKANGYSTCHIPWQLIEIVKESGEVKEPIETGVRKNRVKNVVYCKCSNYVLPLSNFNQLKNVKVKYAFDRYFCSESQFEKKSDGDFVYLFYKKSLNTIIVSNSMKKGAIWNEPCEDIHNLRSFMDLFEKPETATTKTTSSTTATNYPTSSTNEIDFFKKVSKPSSVSPLKW